MLTIRLQRVGRKNDPSFRVVVTDSKNGPQSGKFLEVLGSYNARFGKPQLNAEKIKAWIAKGAKTSATVNNMLVRFKVIEGKTISPLPAKKPEAPAPEVKEEAPVAESAPAEEAPAVEEKVEDTPTETPVEETPVAEVPVETPAEEAPVPEVAEEKTEEATA